MVPSSGYEDDQVTYGSDVDKRPKSKKPRKPTGIRSVTSQNGRPRRAHCHELN